MIVNTLTIWVNVVLLLSFAQWNVNVNVNFVCKSINKFDVNHIYAKHLFTKWTINRKVNIWLKYTQFMFAHGLIQANPKCKQNVPAIQHNVNKILRIPFQSGFLHRRAKVPPFQMAIDKLLANQNKHRWLESTILMMQESSIYNVRSP